MGQLVAIETRARFNTMLESNLIKSSPIYFILDTKLIYTHGIFINGAVYGTESSGNIPLTIGGVSKTLALSSHNHDSLYHKKNANVDIGSNSIISGENNILLNYSTDNIYLGNINKALTLRASSSLSLNKNGTACTILDTSNTSIGNTTDTGYTLNNIAVFKYGGKSFQLNYIRRVNSSISWDTANDYTLAGTNILNSIPYGYISFVLDGTQNPGWALLAININTGELLTRTSNQTTWKTIKDTWTDWVPATSTNDGTKGVYPAPGRDNYQKFLRGDGTWHEMSTNITSALYVGTSSGTSNAEVSTTPYLIFAEGTTYSRYKLEGAGGITVSSDSNGNLKFTGASYSNFTAATDSVAGTSGLVPAPATNQLGSTNYYLRADGTWQQLGTNAFTDTGFLPLAGGTMTGDITLSANTSLVLNTDTTWTDADRSIPFSMDDDTSKIAWYNVDITTGLTYNPNNGTLKAGTFIKRNSSDAYVLLGGGGQAPLANLQVPGTTTDVTSLDITKTFIYATISTGQTIGLSDSMTVGQVLTILAYNNSSANVTLLLPSTWKSLDGAAVILPALKFGEISILCYALDAYIVSSKV